MQRYCWNRQNGALIWPKWGPYMVPIIWHLMVFFYLACMTLQWKFEAFQASSGKDIVEIIKTWPYYGPNMAQTWLLYGRNNLTLISILLFGLHDSTVKIWAISVNQKQRYCRNSQNLALIWPKHGSYMIPIIWHWIVFFYLTFMTLLWKFEPFQESRSKYMVERVQMWPKYDPYMALIWSQ